MHVSIFPPMHTHRPTIYLTSTNLHPHTTGDVLTCLYGSLQPDSARFPKPTPAAAHTDPATSAIIDDLRAQCKDLSHKCKQLEKACDEANMARAGEGEGGGEAGGGRNSIEPKMVPGGGGFGYSNQIEPKIVALFSPLRKSSGALKNLIEPKVFLSSFFFLSSGLFLRLAEGVRLRGLF